MRPPRFLNNGCHGLQDGSAPSGNLPPKWDVSIRKNQAHRFYHRLRASEAPQENLRPPAHRELLRVPLEGNTLAFTANSSQFGSRCRAVFTISVGAATNSAAIPITARSNGMTVAGRSDQAANRL